MKNTLAEINVRLDIAVENVSELEDIGNMENIHFLILVFFYLSRILHFIPTSIASITCFRTPQGVAC